MTISVSLVLLICVSCVGAKSGCAPIEHVDGKCIHPLDNKDAAWSGIDIVTHSGCSGGKIKFCLTQDSDLMHKATGMCIQPETGDDNPANNVKLVLASNCSSSYTKWSFTEGGSIKHVSSGKCWHLYKESSKPVDNNPVVVFDGCDEERLEFTGPWSDGGKILVAGPTPKPTCPQIMIVIHGLNSGDPYIFPATNPRTTVYVRCSNNDDNYISKMCLSNALWDDFTRSSDCSTLTNKFASLQEKVELLNEETSASSIDRIKYLNQVEVAIEVMNLKKVSITAVDVKNMVGIFSNLTVVISKNNDNLPVENLRRIMVESMDTIVDAKTDAIGPDVKTTTADIIEDLAKSLQSGELIKTDNILMQGLQNNADNLVVLEVPEAMDSQEAPILDLKQQVGKQVNVAVMTEQYKKCYPHPKEKASTNSTINSCIVSLNFKDVRDIKDFEFSVTFTPNRSMDHSRVNMMMRRTCVYLDVESGSWKSDGCKMALTADGACVCTCTHTTSFAILLSVSDITDPVQNIATYAMFAINLVFLLLTFAFIAPFSVFRSKQLMLIQLNLIVALVLANVGFVLLSSSSASVDDNGIALFSLNVPCITGVIIVQYLFLSAMTWMSCTAWTLYSKIVDAVKSFGQVDKFYMVKCVVISWIVPTIFPSAAYITSWVMNDYLNKISSPFIGATGESGTTCWVQSPWKWVFFMVPCYLTLLFNIACFSMIARVVIGTKKCESTKQAKALFMVGVVVGLPWIVGALTFEPIAMYGQYLFIVLTGLQGPCLFVSLIWFQDDVKAHTLALFGIKKKPKKQQTSDPSHTTRVISNKCSTVIE